MLSINLGIMNLLPIPALDGGRLLFFGFEAVRGKPIDRQKEGMFIWVHFFKVSWIDINAFLLLCCYMKLMSLRPFPIAGPLTVAKEHSFFRSGVLFLQWVAIPKLNFYYGINKIKHL